MFIRKLPLFVLLMLLSSTALSAPENELLPAAQAYQLSVEAQADRGHIARWIIAEGVYLYKNKTSFTLLGGTDEQFTDAKLEVSEMPSGLRHQDPAFGNVEIYRKSLSLPFRIIASKKPTKPIQIQIKYQGCADIGLCYPPAKKIWILNPDEITTNALPFTTVASTQFTTSKTDATAPVMVSEQDAITAKLASGNMLLTLLSFFGFGLLLAFTPCVFPMIPILSGIIVGEGKNISTRRALSLSLAYVLAMSVAYTLVGVLAGMLGANLQVWFQNPWILSAFALIFVLLSLSMFDVYELQMPASLQGRLTAISDRQRGGSLVGAAIMGFLSAIIVGPCVTAPLIGALAYIGQTGDAVLGGLALFFLSMGMGAPLVLVGVSAGRFLPKAGQWMNAIKAVFGIMLLGVAIWLLERILPTSITMLLWSLLFIASGISLGALSTIPEGSLSWHALRKSMGLATLLWGSLLMIGAAANSTSVLQPLNGLIRTQGDSGTAADQGLIFQQVSSVAELNTALQQAKQQNKGVMLDFYADWCVSCKELESLTFTDPLVKSALSNTLLLQADVTNNNKEHKALLKRFSIIGPPAIVFFDTQSSELKPYRLVGYLSASRFLEHIKKVSVAL